MSLGLEVQKLLKKQHVSNPLQAILGRMAGVVVQQTSGTPGSGINIQIRGQNSLRTPCNSDVNGNLPLYVVDGGPFSSNYFGSISSIPIIVREKAPF